MGPDFVSLLDTDPNSLSLDKTKIWQLSQALMYASRHVSGAAHDT